VAINAGNLLFTPPGIVYDQRGPGFPRVVGGGLDIGAVESTGFFQGGVVIGTGPNAFPNQGNGPRVFVHDQFGNLVTTLAPFGNTKTDARVATGDINGDGVLDLVIASGAGLGQVVAFDGLTGTELYRVNPYGAGYNKGVYIAVGDIDGDGDADIVTGPGSSGQNVKVLDGSTGVEMTAYSFAPFPREYRTRNYTGGVRVAVGDVDNDGGNDVIVSTGNGQPALVQVWDYNLGTTPTIMRQFKPFGSSGAYVAAGDVNGDGFAEIFVGTSGGEAKVRVYDGFSVASGKTLRIGGPSQVFSVSNLRQEARVGFRDIDGDGVAELLVATGPGGTQQVRVFAPDPFDPLSFFLIDTISSTDLGMSAKYQGGLFV
jgi:hypothetical protein